MIIRTVSRTGMALISVVAATALVAMITVSMLSTVGGLHESARSTLDDATLDAAADAALASYLRDWPAANATLAVGGTNDTVAVQNGDSLTVTATRLSDRVFWLVATVSSPTQSRRRLNLVVRSPWLSRDSLSAFVTDGALVATTGLIVARGSDSVTCGTPEAAVLLGANGAVADSTGGALPGLRTRVSAIADRGSTYTHLLGVSREDLIRRAVTRMPGGGSLTLEGSVVFAAGAGDLTVLGTSGEGVIVAAGRVRLQGPMRFVGVIIAGGGIETTADDVEVEGVIVAGLGDVTQHTVLSRVVHRAAFWYSPCRAQVAVAKAVPPWVVSGRGWAELH